MSYNNILIYLLIFTLFYLNFKNIRVNELFTDNVTLADNVLTIPYGLNIKGGDLNLCRSATCHPDSGIIKTYYRGVGTRLQIEELDDEVSYELKTRKNDNTAEITKNYAGDVFIKNQDGHVLNFRKDGSLLIPGDLIVDGKVTIKDTTDVNLSNGEASLVIGNVNGAHLEFDNNEIMAKGNKTTASGLYFNHEGGGIYFGGPIDARSNLTVRGNANFTNNVNIPTERIDISQENLENKIREVYGNEVDLKHLIDIHK